MPVLGCFDDSGLVIQFDIRYCDPSCFVLLSQDCCSCSGSFMVPYEFLKCLFYICEICHGYSNRESYDFLGYGFLRYKVWIPGIWFLRIWFIRIHSLDSWDIVS